MFTIENHLFKPSEIDLILDDEYNKLFIQNNKKISYLNIPVAFDIETTSFYDAAGEKAATMYAWIFGINGKSIIGRTWDEFLLILKRIKEKYGLNDNKRILCFIHNLSFEFGFIQHLFNWLGVFAVDKRKPVYAISDLGIEFRCSYILSGYSLDMVGKNLVKYKCKKMVGDLDYSKYRHSKTPLTDKEVGYIKGDADVLMCYIEELIEQYGDLHKLPLTKTGFCRKYVRTECLYNGNKSHKKAGTYQAYNKYHSLMNTLTISNLKAYNQLKDVYQGGFTHCNGLYNNVIISDVTSFDFCSSYPATMLAEKYPMSSPKLIKQIKSKEDLDNYLKNYCCMFYITLYDVEPRLFQEHPLSASKCFNVKDATEDNGRIVKAKELTTAMNEVDFEVICDFYNFSHYSIWDLRIMEKGYLPTPFIKAVLKLYELKTILKGSTDIDDIIRFMSSKANLNACYGMAVTDILQINRKYENGIWIDEEPNIKEVFDKYNNSKSRFLFYPWGVWVTSYARRNLFMGIQAVGSDYIYADTDSIKIRNADKHIAWINKYNEYIEDKIKNALKWHKLDFSMAKPKTIKGDERMLGIWDFDGHYKRFKTLGAKRYLYEDDNNEMHLTCAGVSKSAVKYMLNKSNNDNTKCFEFFDDNMYIPASDTGKNIHTYIDYPMDGFLTDYLGNTYEYHELSGVHLEGAEYSLSLSKKYLDYLIEIQDWRI